MQPTNLPKFTGDGSVHALSATPLAARWVQIVAESVASAGTPIRIGGTGVSSTEGIPLGAATSAQFFPQDTTDRFNFYDLSTMKYFAASGDTFSVMYA
jgi:hypothetical protein